jgi:hypothetical protein
MNPKRQTILDEARRWLGAKWRHEACVPYIACDCGQYLIVVFHKAGLIDWIDTGKYSRQWMFHQTDERYLRFVEDHARPVDIPLPGDVALWRIGKTFGHGAIVLDWPTVIHSNVHCGVIQEDISHGPLASCEVRFFSVFEDDSGKSPLPVGGGAGEGGS